MKLLAASALISTALAGFGTMEDSYNEIANAAGINRNARIYFPLLKGKGCWCHFDEDHGLGKGVPLNVVDEICKTLADNYECAMRDAEDEGETCVPWEVNYSSSTDLSKGPLEMCSEANDDICAIRACAAEMAFVQSFLAFLETGGSLNIFEPPFECVTKKGGAYSAKACCGEYPDRFPYKTMDGARGCCGQRTYSATTLECCDEGTSLVKFNC